MTSPGTPSSSSTNGSTSSPTPTTTKKCRACGLEKPLDEFPKKKNRCNDCNAIYTQQRPTDAKQIIEVPRAQLPRDAEGRLKMAIELRMQAYKESAIDAIYDLAAMPVSSNPLLMQVKMAAAKLLAGHLPGDTPSAA